MIVCPSDEQGTNSIRAGRQKDATGVDCQLYMERSRW